MPPRKNRKVKKSTTTTSQQRGRGALTLEAEEQAPDPVVENGPAPSVSVAESTSPPSASQMYIVVEVHQPAAQSSSDNDNEFPPSNAAKKRKKEVVTAEFTDEQKQEMVDWLQATAQECLLKKKHPNYIKKGLKYALWEQKTREIGKTSDQLRKWYTNIRSRFGKLKQIPSGSGNSELTARDHWILHQFEFIRPHLIVQVKKRVTVSMKAKVQARAAAAGAPQCESESDDNDHHPHVVIRSDVDTSLGSGSRASDDTEATRSNIAELQKQLLNKLSKAEKSTIERQEDAFADFMKEVTYTFPPLMWLKFQSEVNSLLQKYQIELLQQPPMQTQQQQQDESRRPYPPAHTTGPSSQYPSVSWQPHPLQWPGQAQQPTSVWGSQDASWVQQQFQQQPPFMPQTAPHTYSDSTQLPQPSSASTQSVDMGNFTSLSGSYNSFNQLRNQADDNPELNTTPSVEKQSE